MKPGIRLLLGLSALITAGCVGAQPTAYEPPVPVSTAVQPLDQLVAPIALYPDPLVALILPASTASSDVVLAARYLAGGGDPQQVDAQSWDESVKGLAHYPEVVKWMDENLAWTEQLGAAYMDRPGEVMAAVQRVRAEARAKGLLVDTPQQQVVVDGSEIEILPAQPNVIYVPRYDSDYIFLDRPSYYYESDPWLTFGIGFGVGWWLCNDFDWNRRVIWVDHRSREHWGDRHEWRRPHFPGGPGNAPRDPNWQPWRPAPGRPRPPRRDIDRDRHPVVRPMPLPGTRRLDRDQPARSPGVNFAPRPPADGRRAKPERPANPPAMAPREPVRPTRELRPPAPNSPPNRSAEPRRPEPAERGPDRRDRPNAPTNPPGHPEVRPVPQPAPAAIRQPPVRVAPQRVEPPARTAPTPAPRAPAPEQRRLAPAMPRQERSNERPPAPAANADRGREDRDKNTPQK